MTYKCIMCQDPIEKEKNQWGLEIRPLCWIHYRCIEHLWDTYSSMVKGDFMTEPKPYWIGGAKDGRFSCQLVPLKVDNEPLSEKQLHELIISQSMTIDRLLTRQGELVDVLKRVRDLLTNCKFYEAWIEINRALG